jgi:hypothetical protein
MYRNLYCLFSVVLLLGLVSNTGAAAASSSRADKEKVLSLDTDPNLVGWWKFDDTSGTIAADSSRHKRKGQLKGGLSFKSNSFPGRIGKALKLEDDDDYVQITGYKGVTGTGPRTVSAWIKTTNRRSEFVSWGFDDFGQMFIFGIIRGHGMGITPNGGYYYSGAKAHDNEWHHVVVVVDDVELPNLHDDVRLYEDGELAEIHDIGLLDLWPINTGSDLDVRIGRRLKGLIDDVRIYDRPLSEDEVKVLFNAELKDEK